MTSGKHIWKVLIGCLVTLVCSASAWQAEPALIGVTRVYVESFAVKAEAGNLREEVIAKLRKVSSIAIVSSQSNADAIMTGEGEMWIRGYRSLNPRSGRLPSNGTPVYAGFLSVELKDAKGNTLWSYLVTSSAESENISKDLATRIAKHLAEALAQGGGRTSSSRR